MSYSQTDHDWFYGPPGPSGQRTVWYTKERYWNRQSKPYRHPLDFYVDYRYVNYSDPLPGAGVDGNTSYYYAPGQNFAFNKAYAKFKDKVGAESQWAVNIAERKQGVDMIVKRATQILRFARKLNRFDFVGAAKELGLSKPPNNIWRRRASGFSNLFLEYHFGWEPLIKDIGAAVDEFQRDFDSKRIKVGGFWQGRYLYDGGSGGYREHQQIDFACYVTIGAVVRVSNPDLLLANQLGFVNPLSVAWELVRFSFLVDWIVNVSDVLSAMSDFAGLSVTDSYVTNFQKTIDTYYNNGYPTGIISRYQGLGIFTRRSAGPIPGPVLTLRPITGLSPIRAATAMSLLGQQLAKAR